MAEETFYDRFPDLAVREAVIVLYERDTDGCESFSEFWKRFTWCNIIGCYGGRWCGMYVGIERDGYTHT